ncbi:MAG: adenylyltransferase/cytidyltransferase family protein [Parachlamydia sp.]|jgi:rfaE bifunctional protein nucleotidyltransferase chain/domain|nr:adenylyltransferase/cytidyltransferase family protein [Parachlamydia sp.]
MTWKEACKRKWILPHDLDNRVCEIKNEGKKIATLNGSFDLLHAGHLHMIYEASKQADVLIVALNTDASIRQYKSPERPIIPLEYRLEMMAALEFVDYVTWFDETDPKMFLSVVQPHVHVNGSEYGHQCIEADTVLSRGGQVHIVTRIPGLSTSFIVKKIKEMA